MVIAYVNRESILTTLPVSHLDDQIRYTIDLRVHSSADLFYLHATISNRTACTVIIYNNINSKQVIIYILDKRVPFKVTFVAKLPSQIDCLSIMHN